MSTQTVPTPPAADRGVFGHEAVLYAGLEEFLEGTVPFIETGVAAGEPVLVVVSDAKIRALRGELGVAADAVEFADMDDVGLNPARIIPAWRAFLDANGGGTRPVRGIGEPIWAERSAAELVECQRHETLLNVAFADSGGWELLCPYDTSALDADVIDEAARSHPVVVHRGRDHHSHTCRDLATMSEPFDAPLPEPVASASVLDFAADDAAHVRGFVHARAIACRLGIDRTGDLVLAVHEIVANSLRHGGGAGSLRIWDEGDTIICEVSDAGRIVAPLAGRERPLAESGGGRGLWMVNQLCDLAQFRTFATGTVARLHMRRRGV